MSKINKLEENVFNMIAAGEVVERPMSVVKELIENSIDAGATAIDILIADGGISRIQVSDNGVGIDADDVKTAFAPHATSKIKNITDLDTVSTLGFRGEALPSIASISQVTLVSSTKNDGTATKISLSAGKIIAEGEDSRARGTTITVDNLFFNTPARLKFLKKASTEQRYVTDVVKTLALANPTLQITLADDNQILLNSDGGELINAIYSVYDADTADKLYEIDYKSQDNIRISGFTSSIGFSKPNRSGQTIIVNGRGVTDQTITAAIEKAYSNYLMKRNYPMFVMDIVLPFDEVDVNVHPSKTEVRFRNKQAIFSAVYHAIEDTINKNTYNTAVNLSFNPQNLTSSTQINDSNSANFSNSGYFNNSNVGNNQASNNSNASYNQNSNTSNASYDYSQNASYKQTRIDTEKLYGGKRAPSDYVGADYFNMQKDCKQAIYDKQISYFDNNSNNNDDTKFENNNDNVNYKSIEEYLNISGSELRSDFSNGSDISKNTANSATTFNNQRQNYDNDNFSRQNYNSNSAYLSDASQQNYNTNAFPRQIYNDSSIAKQNFEMKHAENQNDDGYLTNSCPEENQVFDGNIVGQIFDTYIIIERDEFVYIVDQHAAHERILYDKIIDNFDAKYATSLLIPYKFKLNGQEAEYFDSIMPVLNKLGFEVRFEFGNYLMFSMPSQVTKMNFKKFLSELLKNMIGDTTCTVESILKDNICQQACKAAIKGGEHLSREQLQYVVKHFLDSDGNLPTSCPHGRPAVITISKHDIE
ncbi:MAG: DNA mismatch repair endonuclease MutL, partial [Clostridia bacterium]